MDSFTCQFSDCTQHGFEYKNCDSFRKHNQIYHSKFYSLSKMFLIVELGKAFAKISNFENEKANSTSNISSITTGDRSNVNSVQTITNSNSVQTINNSNTINMIVNTEPKHIELADLEDFKKNWQSQLKPILNEKVMQQAQYYAAVGRLLHCHDNKPVVACSDKSRKRFRYNHNNKPQSDYGRLLIDTIKDPYNSHLIHGFDNFELDREAKLKNRQALIQNDRKSESQFLNGVIDYIPDWVINQIDNLSKEQEAIPWLDGLTLSAVSGHLPKHIETNLKNFSPDYELVRKIFKIWIKEKDKEFGLEQIVDIAHNLLNKSDGIQCALDSQTNKFVIKRNNQYHVYSSMRWFWSDFCHELMECYHSTYSEEFDLESKHLIRSIWKRADEILNEDLLKIQPEVDHLLCCAIQKFCKTPGEFESQIAELNEQITLLKKEISDLMKTVSQLEEENSRFKKRNCSAHPFDYVPPLKNADLTKPQCILSDDLFEPLQSEIY